MRTLTNRKPSAAKGMTLIEILITLSIVAIVVGLLASGNFRDLLDGTWMWSSKTTLVGSIQLAKSEAVTRNIEVGLCATDIDNPDQCSSEGDDAWKNGFLMFSNPDASGKFVVGSSEWLRIGDKMPDGQQVTAPSYAFVFSPDGTVEPKTTPED